MPRNRKQYTEEEKAEALAILDANGGSVRRTSVQTGIPLGTLESWSKGRGLKPKVAVLRTEKRRDLSEKLDEIAHKLADILPDKIENSNLVQAATALAIAIDKAQLLKGQPTAINQNVNLTHEQRVARITAIADAARTRRAG